MGMHVHELHAAAVHAPMVLLPAAAIVDLRSALMGGKGSGALGKRLWWLAVGAGAFAGAAGLAASQEVKTEDPAAEDAMWLHGVGNTAIVLGGLGIAVWRTFRRPSVGQAALGLGACAAAMFTAYLGGEMVYARGVGVRAMPRTQKNGVHRSPRLLSRKAPATFVRDVAAGFVWLADRTAAVLTGKSGLHKTVLGVERSR